MIVRHQQYSEDWQKCWNNTGVSRNSIRVGVNRTSNLGSCNRGTSVLQLLFLVSVATVVAAGATVASARDRT